VYTSPSANLQPSAAIESTTRPLRAPDQSRTLDKWRDELFPVDGPSQELLFSIERSASPIFGVVIYSVNMTVFRKALEDDAQGSPEVWVPFRSKTRAKFPGTLDSSVGGGLATGETPQSCLLRESDEEASLESSLVHSASEAGTLTCLDKDLVVTWVWLNQSAAMCSTWISQAFLQTLLS
jgi:hypothetical protein